jgi:long-chain acyl-CoA synthetase
MPVLVPFETAPELFYNLAERYKGTGREVVRYKDRQTKDWVGITWDEMVGQVEAFAGYLHSVGVRPGDRVAILSENRPEWFVTDMATQILGAVNVSLYTTLPAQQVGYIAADSGAKVFVASTSIQLRKAEQVFDECPDLERIVAMSDARASTLDYVETWDEAMETGRAYYATNRASLRALAEAVAPDDLSALIYTSGTTGQPKGVMLTHANFCSNAKAASDAIEFGEDDHHLSFLPLCHSFERTAGYLTVLANGTLISYAESVDAVSKNLLEVHPTILVSVPRLFERVYNVIAKGVEEGGPAKQKIFGWAVATGKKAAATRRAGKKPGPLLAAQVALANKLVFGKLHEKLGGKLRFAVSGGAALPQAIGEFFEAAGVVIIEGYGLTETAPVLAANPLDAPRYGSVGRILPGVTVGIMKDDVVIAQHTGTVGGSETLSSGEGEIVARGPNIMRGYWNNDDATREAIDEAGWYHTGDVGRFSGGYLQITDRIKHMIVSKGGKNIYPGPIEDAFKTDPMIDQMLVVGEGREFLTALVVANPDAARQMTGAETDEAAMTHSDVHAYVEKALRQYSKGAASHERIRDFRLLAEPFTVENELMTPTMKLRRRAIEGRHEALIDEMYAAVV